MDEPLYEQLPRYSRSRAKICTVCCRCFETVEMEGQSLLLLVRWLSLLKGTISYVLTLQNYMKATGTATVAFIIISQ